MEEALMKGCIPITNEQIKKMLGTFKGQFATRNKCMIVLGVFSGFRISEMLSIRIKDIYLQDKVVDQVYVPRASMKGSKEGRSVNLHPVAKQYVLKLIRELESEDRTQPDSFLFKGRKGDYSINRKSAWRILKSASLDIGIIGKIGTHTLRKTFADRLLDKYDGDVFKLQIAMGHSKVDSTIQYVQFKNKEITDAILALDYEL